MALGEDMMERQAEIQISLKERERFQNEPFHKLIEEVPEMNVKNFLRWLFENVSKGFHLYSINSDDCCCLILVNNLLFDYNHKTPAIDLAFYFLPDSDISQTKMESVMGAVTTKVLQPHTKRLPFSERGDVLLC